ncbi:unnamed protein product, partial [Tetraodon nigroviridis]
QIKLAFFVAIVGVVLTVLGVGTEFWVELAPPKSFYDNQTCLTAYYGLWKGCTKTLWVADIDPERESCGPAELPGDSLLATCRRRCFSQFPVFSVLCFCCCGRIKLHLLQVLHHRRERCDVSEDNAEESERSYGHAGHVQPLPDGDGSHLHHHVAQQRDPLFSQASGRLLHPVRSVGARPACTCSCLRWCSSLLFPLQGSWCFCLCWSSTSPCWPCSPVSTRCLFPTTSPGPCRASAAPERFLLWAGSSSCCWRCPAAPGRGVSLIRTAAASRSDI